MPSIEHKRVVRPNRLGPDFVLRHVGRLRRQGEERKEIATAQRIGTELDIGAEPQKCEKCGSDKVFFVQHSHGNYPILDYVCPKCDLGGDQGVPDWYMNPTGKDDAPED